MIKIQIEQTGGRTEARIVEGRRILGSSFFTGQFEGTTLFQRAKSFCERRGQYRLHVPGGVRFMFAGGQWKKF